MICDGKTQLLTAPADAVLQVHMFVVGVAALEAGSSRGGVVEECGG